jgi:uncharacterized membrane protein YhaH (DUF805 family)
MLFEYYINAFKNNYVNFSGRARRKEFWGFTLFNTLMYFVLIFVGVLITDGDDASFAIFGIYFLGSALPMLAVACRRLHDIGKSGTMYFVRFIPIAGPIWLLVMYVTEGESGPNRYGDDPKNGGYGEFDEIGRPDVF